MKAIVNKYKRELVVLVATIAMGAIFTALNSNFLSWNNILTIFQKMVLNGVLAAGMMFTIITAGIDLSIGCTFAITGIAVASCCVNGVPAGICNYYRTADWCCGGSGFNGVSCDKFKVTAIYCNIKGTMSLYRGIAYVVTGGQPGYKCTGPVSGNIFNGKMFFGIRYYVIVMIVVFVLAHIMLAKTKVIIFRWRK